MQSEQALIMLLSHNLRGRAPVFLGNLRCRRGGRDIQIRYQVFVMLVLYRCLLREGMILFEDQV